MSPQHSDNSRHHRKTPGRMSTSRFYALLVAFLVVFMCSMAVIDGVVHGHG